jgi:hypothetical protein
MPEEIGTVRLLGRDRLRRFGRRSIALARRLLRSPARLALYGPSARPWAPMRSAPGHYYSPLPSVRDIDEYRGRVAFEAPPPRAIDLRLYGQLELLRDLKPLIDTHPFDEPAEPGRRYRLQNPYFGGADAVVFNALLRKLQPRRIIEVGSGWSTAVLLDTYDGHGQPDITLVEPYPERLFEVLREDDRSRLTLLQTRLQDVPPEHIESLQAGDLLFVDSSHVSKLGSDVNHLVFEILPRVSAGVFVHLHDIFFPFEYPVAWVEEGRGWNETYLVRAFLEFNDAFEILLWNDLLRVRYGDLLRAEFPMLAAHSGGSLWLRRSA